MSDIYLVTPPDKLFNKNYSVLLLYPSDELKRQVQTLLEGKADSINVYLYEANTEEQNIPWVLESHRICDLVIIDIDFVDHHVKDMLSYLISFNHTYWRSQGENLMFNKLSCNRFYQCEEIRAFTQEVGETKQKIL